jgi:hypothetical protein
MVSRVLDQPRKKQEYAENSNHSVYAIGYTF